MRIIFLALSLSERSVDRKEVKVVQVKERSSTFPLECHILGQKGVEDDCA